MSHCKKAIVAARGDACGNKLPCKDHPDVCIVCGYPDWPYHQSPHQ